MGKPKEGKSMTRDGGRLGKVAIREAWGTHDFGKRKEGRMKGQERRHTLEVMTT